MKQITSQHNQQYKQLKQLASSAKYRRQVSQTMLEGVHLAQSYLQQSGRPIFYACTDKAKDNPEVAKILDQCEAVGVPGVLLGEANFSNISNVENGVGLIFVIATSSPEAPALLGHDALLLENIQDPGNMGAILRTAAAAGLKDIYISDDSVSVWSPKVLRAGMGAHFVLNIYENQQLSTIISSAKIPVLATSLEATATIYQKNLTTPTAWLFGNEGNGVSEDLLALDVKKVIIPQQTGVESLNVAAAAAICMFEQLRQRM